jgi:hypothetical protein
MAITDVSAHFAQSICQQLKKIMAASLKIGKKLLMIGALAVIGGCGDYVLIACHPGGFTAPEDQWHELKDCREPECPAEKAVVAAAKLKNSVKAGNITATCLAADEKSQIVVAAVGNSSETDLMAPKSLTNYRVVDGKIDAYSETVSGPSPDADYEKTIYSAARGAMVNLDKSVIIYTRPEQVLTVTAYVEGGCVITVRVRAGLNPSGEVISERKINVCNAKTGNDVGISLPRGTLPPSWKMR